MRVLGANLELVVPFKVQTLSLVPAFFSGIDVSSVKVYLENGEFVSKDYPPAELSTVLRGLLGRKPRVVGATLVRGNVSDIVKRGLIQRTKIKLEKVNSMEFAVRSFFPKELAQDFALRLGTAIQKGSQPDLDPSMKDYVESLRKTYQSLKKDSGAQIDAFYEVNYYNQEELSKVLGFFEEAFFGVEEEVLVTCFETIKTDASKIQCAVDEDTYLRKEKLVPGKIAALVEKYVVCTLMTPKIKMEIDHWIELNTLICHLSSGDGRLKEYILSDFFGLWKLETAKKPVRLPIFESLLKEEM